MYQGRTELYPDIPDKILGALFSLRVHHFFKRNLAIQYCRHRLSLIRHIQNLEIQLSGNPHIIFHQLDILDLDSSLSLDDTPHILLCIRNIVIFVQIKLVKYFFSFLIITDCFLYQLHKLLLLK